LPRQKEILFVSHDANRAGAQIFLYNIMDHLQESGFKAILLLVNEWGSYKEEMESKFQTYSMTSPPKSALDRFLKGNSSTIDTIKIRHNIDLIYVNTIASVHLLEELKTTIGAPVISHIHELSYSIAQYSQPNSTEQLFKYSDRVVACSKAVADNLAKYGDAEKIEIIHSFVNNDSILGISRDSNKQEIRERYNLDENFTWVCACGNADWRKAPDIFLQIAANVKNETIRFAWIGIKQDDPLAIQLKYDAERLGLIDKIVWIEPTPDAVSIINTSDYFLLCSREDPFPLVMLEAALCKKPIFTFKNTGGGDEFVEDDAGKRVDYLNVCGMANTIDTISLDSAAALGEVAKKKVLENYSFENSILKIENLIDSYL
jgi:glycosyltransferase involved in cell wall biosynthesis